MRIASAIAELTEALFRESNPGPVKSALALLDIMPARVRLPLVEPGEATKAELASVLAGACERYPDWIVGRFTPDALTAPAVPTSPAIALAV
jgi:hypothetical protein